MGNRTKNRIKVAISYLDKEDRDAIREFVKGRFSDAKVKETPPKDGYLHTVLTVPNTTKSTK